ncbi:hypothetical protein [Actinokineospora iranica]|uniref:Uncharacterized protein n=1 Tax=Actinokineospora iranica TaxID=1271860 RepID=A0A1G6ZB25_9PSEU|nr:hypothetical protein [Actinokineospora iranica]SDD99503.1 hypothetical protein SAMN05216174_12725 [Actinokineospora iranica]
MRIAAPVCVLAAVAAVLAPLPAAALPGLSVTVAALPMPAGLDRGAGLRVTEVGQIVGTAGTRTAPWSRALSWRLGRVTDLGAGQAVDANVFGHAVGAEQDTTAPGFVTKATLWRDGHTVRLVPQAEHSTAVRINDRGEVLVTYRLPGTTGKRVGVWRRGTVTELAVPGPVPENLDEVVWNAEGQVAGAVRNFQGNEPSYAFRCDTSGACARLPALNPEGDQAVLVTGIDRAGQVYGFTVSPAGVHTAVRWTGDRAVPLPALTSTSTMVVGISPHGDYAVGLGTDGDGVPRVLRWHAGQVTDLGVQPAATLPIAVNDRGDVLVYSITSLTQVRSWVWRAGRRIDLPTLGGDHARAYSLNNLGQAVGESRTADGATVPAVWTLPLV